MELYSKIILSVCLLFIAENGHSQTKIIPQQEVQVLSGIFFAATMDQPSSTITITMIGPDNKWFGVGFGLTMSDADILLYTDGKAGAMHPVGASDYDLNAQNSTGVNQDAIQDWTIQSDNVSGGNRTVVASRDLNSGDAIDHILNFNDASLNVIWAKANAASFTLGYHGGSNRGTLNMLWQLQDVTPPSLVVSPFTPNDNQIDVSLGTNLTVEFDEPITEGTGNIELRLLSSNAVVESFDVNSQVTISGNQLTMNLAANLTALTEYYIVIPNGAISDLASNAYTGFTDNATWNFTTLDNSGDTTPPSLVAPFSPADDEIDVLANTTLSMDFDEDVQPGIGNVELWQSTGTLIESFDINGASVVFNGATITITPTNSLSALTDYYITIDNGAIEDLATNSFSGISSNSDWNFTTIDDNNGLAEVQNDIIISIDGKTNISIQNKTGGEFKVEFNSLSGQMLFASNALNQSTSYNLEKYLGQAILVKVSTKTKVITEMIQL